MCEINNQKYLVEGLMGSCWMQDSLTAVQQFSNTDKRQLKRGCVAHDEPCWNKRD